MRKKLTIFIGICTFLICIISASYLLFEKNHVPSAETEMVTSSNFILYDFSRILLSETGIQTRYIHQRELTKADENKLKNSSLTFCMGNEVWKDEYENVCSVFYETEFQPMNNKNLADEWVELKSGYVKTDEEVKQIIPDKIPDYIIQGSTGDRGILAKTAYIDWHFWMSLEKADDMFNRIAATLEGRFPLYADKIEENRESYEKDLLSLKKEYEKAVFESQNRMVFVCGNMYYEYMFEELEVSYSSIHDFEETTADVERLSQMADVINAYGVRFLIKDKESGRESLEYLQTAVDHNLTALILDTGEFAEENSSFLEIMKNNLVILKKSIL